MPLQQAHQRKLDDMLIVDVDAHHYENEHFKGHPAVHGKRCPPAACDRQHDERAWRGTIMPTQVGYQDMGGRVTRYPLRSSEKTDHSDHKRDIQLGHRWMDAMLVDYSCLFPTGMLNVGLHPQKEMEVELCWAYNRWVTEKVLPESAAACSRC